MTVSPSLSPGTTVGSRYRMVREIAQGGMGAVYEAHDTRLNGRRCAVKVLSAGGMTPDEQAEATAWFDREAHILSELQHPLIPNISDYFSEQGRHYLVMDYVEGETLEDVLAREGTPGLPIAEVVGWGIELCAVLEYLHTRRPPVIFRDLKPANVMCEPAGTLKLIDFGIARSLEGSRSGQTVYTTIGTPGYSPPEQYQGLADPRSDVYSLGATLHHLLSGRDPRKHQPFTFPALASLVPEIDPALDAAIAQAVSMQADARFASARAFAEALSGQTTAQVGHRSTPTGQKALRPTRRAAPRTTQTPRPAPGTPPVDPLHPPAPLPAKTVSVTSDRVYWPPVCACCCRSADMDWIVEYGEREQPSGQMTRLSWHIPYCSMCAQHARAHRAGQGKAHTRDGLMWGGLAGAAYAILFVGTGNLSRATACAIALILLAGMAVGVIVLGRLAHRWRDEAQQLMGDTCGADSLPITYNRYDPVYEFHFTNGAYADLFAAANADKLF